MRIINLNTNFYGAGKHSVASSDFFSDLALLDADIVFWDTNSTYERIIKILGNNPKEDTFQIVQKKIVDRKNEMLEFLELGRSIVIINPGFEKAKINCRTDSEQNHTFEIDLLEFFNLDKQELEIKKGNNFSSIDDPIILGYIANYQRVFSYQRCYKKYSGHPLFFINNTTYVISQYFHINNGVLLCFPNISNLPNESSFSDNFITETYKLTTYLKSLRNNEEFVIPEWASEYFIRNEDHEINKLKNLNDQLEQINTEIKEQKEKLDKFQQLKLLFCSDGAQLENIVGYIFEKFGFEVEIQNSNRDDLIIKFEDRVAVVEVKGLTKSAGEKNAAQLEKWVSSYLADNNVNPKGILVVNTFKKQVIEERKNENFPNQMLRYSNNREHCLITGIQLLCLYIDYMENKISQGEVIDKIFTTVGILTYTNQLQNYIRKIETIEES